MVLILKENNLPKVFTSAIENCIALFICKAWKKYVINCVLVENCLKESYWFCMVVWDESNGLAARFIPEINTLIIGSIWKLLKFGIGRYTANLPGYNPTENCWTI